MQSHRARSSWRSLPLTVLSALALAACSPLPAASDGECWTLARVPGPEDLVILKDEKAALVSSQERRASPPSRGAIWYVPLDTTDPAHRPRRLPLRGRRDECSFHPHGIDLVWSDTGQWLLYVINHHDAGDRASERECFTAPIRGEHPGSRITSIEIYAVEGHHLRFLQRLADPGVLGHANDLVAERDGDLWVTVPPGGGLATLFEGLRWQVPGFERSRIVRFECRHARPDGRCIGTWHEVDAPFEPPLSYANGIEIERTAEQGEAATLYVASASGERIHRLRLDEGGGLRQAGTVELPGLPDNLIWENREESALLVAVHPDRRRFLQHRRSPDTPSPSAVYRVRAGEDPRRERLFEDPGGVVSTASVAACVEGDLVIGQVFDPAVLRCPLPVPCDEGRSP